MLPSRMSILGPWNLNPFVLLSRTAISSSNAPNFLHELRRTNPDREQSESLQFDSTYLAVASSPMFLAVALTSTCICIVSYLMSPCAIFFCHSNHWIARSLSSVIRHKSGCLLDYNPAAIWLLSISKKGLTRLHPWTEGFKSIITLSVRVWRNLRT